ncbi:Methyltransferase domain-containing protein [Austwickia chelonae]|uniref:Putative methyltransferase n=1 Tax=Austwickia chelonae NBRC 105200 TaxID=1184607 RepID=K6VNF7_9MICO|nr:class I SAM-dependent methyltransferase [Austwickia chelonae]GAB76915.1 putative methyltransferase [Austwickia chelonae NBRC 105200]SEW32310.1 Methyltransferase domain-containing protein [Austwickia chelonae]
MSLWSTPGRASDLGRRLRAGRSCAAIPSPNIWEHPEVYEIENQAVDPDGLILSALCRRHPPAGRHLLDLGCGTGFHLPVFAGLAGPTGRVTGVEPHLPLVAAARRRVALDPQGSAAAPMSVLVGAAQEIPLPDDSVDIVHARWAYFFGPGCEPGLAEVARVLSPGGTAFLIDNDATRSTFGSWFRREHPNYDPIAIERFWKRRGFTAEQITMRWQMNDRADFEAVIRIEFSPRIAESILQEYRGDGVDYAINIWHSRY